MAETSAASPPAPVIPRRNFLQQVIGAIAAFLGFAPPAQQPTTAQAAKPASTSFTPPAPEILAHLPGRVEDLVRLNDEYKVMLSATTASGCDAAAYYKADDQGRLIADKIVQMYPPAHYRESGGRQPQFAGQITGFQSATFSTADQVLAHTEYHIPVYRRDAKGDRTNILQGVIVLHAPQEGLSKLQDTATNNRQDMHEPVATRMAKLRLASFIVGEHEDLFGAAGALLKQREDRHHSISAKLGYFKKLIAESRATLGEGNDQQSHVDHVAKLMDITMNRLNKDPAHPLVTPEQAELIHDLTELHDIGKSQMSSAFMRPWQRKIDDGRETYFMEQNHNHPLFTLLELLLYPTDAKTAASHHHGVFRYGSDELKQALGEDFDRFTILKDNLKPEEISPLSYLMRICDVAESMTGRGTVTMEQAVQQLADKVQLKDGQPVIGPGTIHPDYLCLMIHNGVFDHFERNTHPEKLREVESRVLEQFGWTKETAASKESALLAKIAADPLLKDPANHSQCHTR